MPSSKQNLLLTLLSKLQGKRALAEYFSLMFQETEVSEDQITTLIETIAEAIKAYRQEQQMERKNQEHHQEEKDLEDAEMLLEKISHFP